MNNSANNDWPRRVAILGVGLLGGSVALAMRRVRPECRFIGYSRTPDKLDEAIRRGIIDSATDSVVQACGECDAIVVASPVDRIGRMVIDAAHHSPVPCLITDVGSTKAGIVAEVETHPASAAKFVAAHPIAGSEKSGFQHATASLLDQKIIVLTPGPSANPDLIERADQFWKLTGGVTQTMNASDHDAHLAAISHVPHLVAALVARMVPPGARTLVGSGWQDITRVAAGDPEMWTAICRENRSAVSAELTRLSDELSRLRAIVESFDEESFDDGALKKWLSEAKSIKEQR